MNIDEASAGAVYFSSAFRAPIATTASEMAGRNGIMMRTRWAHSAVFSGENPAATRRTTGPGKIIAASASTPR